MKRVLMIAFHFPPLRGSSGIQRTLRFAQHLPELGWEPLILTAHPRAYDATSPDQLDEIPPDMVVERAFALDTKRHLALAGRYPKLLGLPDRWASWYPGAVWTGLKMVRRYRPDAIWSTFPIATAHQIGLALARRTGLPWIADFRDPMAHDGFPPDPDQWRAYQRIESRVLPQADYSVFATPGAARLYVEKYPQAAARIRVIENGYDEESFVRAEQQSAPATLPESRFLLLHSGLIYPSERDPRALFAAVARLKSSGVLNAGNFCLRLRAPGETAWLMQLCAEHQIDDLVELAPSLSYTAALQEMMRSDGLLILQASNCNQQIPAKLYEYLRSRRPVLALTDPAGDTAAALVAAQAGIVVRLDQVEAIAKGLAAFIERVRAGPGFAVSPEHLQGLSRKLQTASLAALLDHISASSFSMGASSQKLGR